MDKGGKPLTVAAASASRLAISLFTIRRLVERQSINRAIMKKGRSSSR